jgi:hypothetical protein
MHLCKWYIVVVESHTRHGIDGTLVIQWIMHARLRTRALPHGDGAMCSQRRRTRWTGIPFQGHIVSGCDQSGGSAVVRSRNGEPNWQTALPFCPESIYVAVEKEEQRIARGGWNYQR